MIGCECDNGVRDEVHGMTSSRLSELFSPPAKAINSKYGFSYSWDNAVFLSLSASLFRLRVCNQVLNIIMGTS